MGKLPQKHVKNQRVKLWDMIEEKNIVLNISVISSKS